MGIFDEDEGQADAHEPPVEDGVDRAQEFAQDWVGSTQPGEEAQPDPRADEFSEQWTGDNQPEDGQPPA